VQIRRCSKQKDTTPEPDLIPVLGCMFLLIPALLLAMEVATMGSVTVSPPRYQASTGQDPGQEHPFRFLVTVRNDGFLAKVGYVRSTDDSGTEIEVRGAEHDFASLESLAKELKHQYRDESRVTVTAESDIPLQTIVRTLDALRGRNCSFADASIEPGDECLFWDVVIES
jgi:biopolymer transport protein ExbD